MWGNATLRRRPTINGEPVILHAGTAKPRRSLRPWIYETIQEYIMGLIDLVNAIDRLERGHLVIRYRPFGECSVEELRARLPSSPRASIKTEGRFLTDLENADLLVSFSSTTLEEALHARRPVLQYAATRRYRHLPGQVWGKGSARRAAVYSVYNPGDLESALGWILDRHAGNLLSDDEVRGYVFPGDRSADELARCLADPQLLHARLVRDDSVGLDAGSPSNVDPC